MIEIIKELAKKYEEDVIDLRRHFHMNPETSWNEAETSKHIAEELKKIGCENIKVGFGGTEAGVVVDIIGGKSGKCVALRADIDALPLNDEKNVTYKSQKAGVMHACGHDAHAAMLIGVAKILQDIKADLKGTVRLLFQPAEEHGIRPGAKVLMDEGALDGVDAVFGIHVISNLPSGTFEYRVGPFMAAADGWELTIHGKGGHGSSPEGAIDPTVATFEVGNAFQTVISREVSPKDTAVISIGGIKTSSQVFNIIPERVDMTGTVRTFRPEVQDTVQEAMTRLSQTICQAYRCRADFKYTRFIPPTINEETTTMLAKSVAENIVGADKVKQSDLMMGSEDFSYYGRVAKACFAYLGCADAEKKSDMPHHSPKFDVDESVLFSGTAILAAFAWNYLEDK